MTNFTDKMAFLLQAKYAIFKFVAKITGNNKTFTDIEEQVERMIKSRKEQIQQTTQELVYLSSKHLDFFLSGFSINIKPLSPFSFLISHGFHQSPVVISITVIIIVIMMIIATKKIILLNTLKNFQFFHQEENDHKPHHTSDIIF